MIGQRLDQLYCTHCTYRTSALHRREGALGDQVFDESARASSVSRDKCHDVFRTFSSYLLYHVPGDMPGAEMVKHTAHSLPLRRLIYLPSVAGNRLLAQVCFRPTDCSGRPGASFSHVLIQDLKEYPDPWSPLDCLKMWGSDQWVVEDSANLEQDLAPFSQLAEFDSGANALINDQVLLSFLQTPVGAEFCDCGSTIPERWRKETPQTRQQLLVFLLQATLNLDFERRESLFVVAEPAFAALLFYGIFRLLPTAGITERLSFSTYQSHRDRVVTVLAATCFHDPNACDLPPEWYFPQARGTAYNTFKRGRHTPLKSQAGQFADQMVAIFMSGGLPAVETILDACNRLGVRSSQQLHQIPNTIVLATELLKPQSQEQLAVLQQRVPRDPGLRAFLSEKLGESISLDPKSPLWADVFARPGQALLVLKLLMEVQSFGAVWDQQPLIRTIIALWPKTLTADLLNDEGIPRKWKVEFVNQFVESANRLPLDAESLFFVAGSICRRENILEDVLRPLRGERLRQFVQLAFHSFPSEACFSELLRNLVPLSDSDDHNQAFDQLFDLGAVTMHPPEQRRRFLSAALSVKIIRDKVNTWLENDVISAHLLDVLNTLDKEPRKLDQQLDVLEDLQKFIPTCKERICAWRVVSTQLKELQRLNSNRGSLIRQMLGQHNNLAKERAAKDLGLAAMTAFAPEYELDGRDVRCVRVVRLLSNVLGGEDRIPRQFLAHLSSFFPDATPLNAPKTEHVEVSHFPGQWLFNAAATFGVVVIFVIVMRDFVSPHLQTTEIADNKKTESNSFSDVAQPIAPKDAGDSKENATNNDGKQSLKVINPASDNLGQKVPANPAKLLIPPESAVPKVMPAVTDEKAPLVAKPALKEPAPNRPAMATDTLPIKWPSYYRLPRLGLAKLEGRRAKPSSKDGTPNDVGPENISVPNPFELFERLQQWNTAKSIELKLVGVKELNSRLQKHGNSRRIYLSIGKSEESDSSNSIFVYKLTKSELILQENKPSRESLRNSDLLCGFDMRETGLYFSWAKTAEDDLERRSFQQMVKLCGLCVESQVDRPVINLIHQDEIFSPSVPASYSYDKQAKTHGGAAFQFHSTLEGVDAFQWIATKGRISYRNDKRSDEFELPLPNTQVENTDQITLNDSGLAGIWNGAGNAVCGSVFFTQTLRRGAGGRWALNVLVKPDWDEKNALERKRKLEEVMPLPRAIDRLMSKIPPFSTEASGDAKLLEELKTINILVKKWDEFCRTDRVLNDPNTPPLSALSELIKRDPFVLRGVKIDDETTINELGEAARDLHSYLIEVRTSCGIDTKDFIVQAYNRAANEAGYARNDNEGLDPQAKSLITKFRSIEIDELRRRIDNRWIPIYTEQKLLSRQ